MYLQFRGKIKKIKVSKTKKYSENMYFFTFIKIFMYKLAFYNDQQPNFSE